MRNWWCRVLVDVFIFFRWFTPSTALWISQINCSVSLSELFWNSAAVCRQRTSIHMLCIPAKCVLFDITYYFSVSFTYQRRLFFWYDKTYHILNVCLTCWNLNIVNICSLLQVLETIWASAARAERCDEHHHVPDDSHLRQSAPQHQHHAGSRPCLLRWDMKLLRGTGENLYKIFLWFFHSLKCNRRKYSRWNKRTSLKTGENWKFDGKSFSPNFFFVFEFPYHFYLHRFPYYVFGNFENWICCLMRMKKQVKSFFFLLPSSSGASTFFGSSQPEKENCHDH